MTHTQTQGADGAGTFTGRPQPLTILYTNWRGETAVRRILIDAIAYGNEALGLAYGRNEWHPEEQWLLSATDADKGERRTFAMAGIKAWGQAAVDAALADGAGTKTAGEVRTILARLWCLAEGNDPDDTISDAGHTVLDGTLGGLDKKVFVAIIEAERAILKATTPPGGPRYQCREIGEGEGWFDCSREFYEAAQSSPHLDTRKVAPAPAATPGAPDSLRALLERLAKASQSLAEFPPNGLVRGDLYVAAKNEGQGTGWRYVCSGASVSDLDAAASLIAAQPAGQAGDAGAAETGWPASYQETFNAIQAATKIQGGMISVSVRDFYRALSYPDPAALEANGAGDLAERLRRGIGEIRTMAADPENKAAFCELTVVADNLEALLPAADQEGAR